MPTMMPPPPMNHPHRNPFPFFRRYVVVNPVACRPVYSNQTAIDALNGLLSNCDKLRGLGMTTCTSDFTKAVQNELNNQLAKAVYIGQSCNNLTYNY